jgi:acyl carrier protein
MTEFVQSQILEAQRLTQQAILESFAMTLRGMGGGAEGVPALTAQPVMRMLPGTAPALTAPVTAPAPTVTPQPNLEPAPVASTPAPSGPNAAAAPTVVRQSATTAHSAEAPVPTHAAATADVVLRVIAASTGYPIEALAPDMELEADLGIDSIKRVEILAALADKVAGLDAQSADPAKIRRVKDLLGLLEGSPAGPQ